MSNNLLGFIFLVLGVWMYVSPKSVLDLKAEFAKVFGAKLAFGKKTITYCKYFGLVILALGLLMILGFV